MYKFYEENSSTVFKTDGTATRRLGLIVNMRNSSRDSLLLSMCKTGLYWIFRSLDRGYEFREKHELEKKGNKIPGRERQKGKPNLSRTDLRFFQKRVARGHSKRQGTTVSGVKQIAQGSSRIYPHRLRFQRTRQNKSILEYSIHLNLDLCQAETQ